MNRRVFLAALPALAAARSLLVAAGAVTPRIGLCTFSCHQHWKAVADKYDGVKFTEAVAFSKKIGNGWRMPTLWEIQGSNQHVMKALAMGKTERAGKYGGGGWDCVGLAVWTTTGVTDMPNFVNMAKCTGITTGNDMKSSALSVFDKFGDTLGLLILVRNK